jgi:hypothetical protein
MTKLTTASFDAGIWRAFSIHNADKAKWFSRQFMFDRDSCMLALVHEKVICQISNTRPAPNHLDSRTRHLRFSFVREDRRLHCRTLADTSHSK